MRYKLLENDIDPVTQEISQAGASPMRGVSAYSDISSFSHRPNELSEELVRTVASIHQRAAESQLLGAPLARTPSHGNGSSKRKFGRRLSQVSSATTHSYTNSIEGFLEEK